MACNVDVALSVLAKVLCIAVLVLQSALLDYIIVRADIEAGACRYAWIGVDVVVVLFWVASLATSHRFFQRLASREDLPASDKGHHSGAGFFSRILKELPLAYMSWLLYAVVLIIKINRMFCSFAEKLTTMDETLLSSTSLKIVLSLAGVIFALLAYAHHNEAHNTHYKLLMEKLGLAASIDLLDVVMLLDILFVAVNRVEITFAMDRAVRAFASICILLPVVPLLTLRIIAASGSQGGWARRSYPLALVLNSALFLFLVNVPLLVIRLVLWFHHDVDVTTFLTKNIMAIAMGAMDIYRHLVDWRRDLAKNPDVDMVQMEPVPTSPAKV